MFLSSLYTLRISRLVLAKAGGNDPETDKARGVGLQSYNSLLLHLVPKNVLEKNFIVFCKCEKIMGVMPEEYPPC
jgi:hypothetical protein